MAKSLFTTFGAIPAASPKMGVTKTDFSPQSKLDAYRMRAALQLGRIALERASVFGTSLPEKMKEKSLSASGLQSGCPMTETNNRIS